ncbi:MAG: LamG domain-containing protein [Gammaproteobacteria bacterium]|nr:LamG domain-containing protein [Gammaproteobacteria bacterium]MBU1654702.1 LamG domain-containing protein [Gammaproteobacteria bacterium]MBU1961426.1 LamG domain-containing protein [Gammaproteobacteria bacterium]
MFSLPSIRCLLLLLLLPWGTANAAPGDTLFTDGFESSMAQWTLSNTSRAGRNTMTAGSGSYSLYLRNNTVSVTLAGTVNLAAVGGARLDFWVRRGADGFSEDPDAGEDLVVEYLDVGGVWQALGQYPGDGTAGEIIQEQITLPAAALHAGFSLRFRLLTGSGSDFDYWHLDDIAITELGLPVTGFIKQFCDDFEGGLGNWTLSNISNVITSNQTYQSAGNALVLRWRAASATSRALSLDHVTQANVTAWLRRGSDSFSENPDAGENLYFEYLDNTGAWRTIASMAGGGTQGEIVQVNYSLPANAMHAGFQMRLRTTGGSGSDYDYWHADDVCVTKNAYQPVAEYWMEKPLWNGTSGEVTDTSGSGLHGTAYGGATTASASPAIAGSPGTCRYGVFDRAGKYVQIGRPVAEDFTIGFWLRRQGSWPQNANWWDNAPLIWADLAGAADDFAVMGKRSGGNKILFVIKDVEFLSSSSLANNTWTYVAVTRFRATGEVKIYINGALDLTATSTNLNALNAASATLIGGTATNDYPGWMDEVRFYNQVLNQGDIQAVMALTHPCSIPGGVDPFGFNCIESSEANALTGHLFTKLVGQAFQFDVAALRDADGNGVADAVETSYAIDANRTVAVELVDTSSGTCGTYAPIASQNLTFTAADAGRKIGPGWTINRAYRSLGCRVTDTGGATTVVGCSTDSFSLRPTALTLTADTLTNGGSSGDPKARAGENFSLHADGGVGYDGTPKIDPAKLEAHAGAIATGTLSPLLFPAADALSGRASGSAFNYSEVGTFRLQTQGLYDDGFTAIDSATGDCTADFSNSAVGGKYGCNLGNSGNTAWVGRFTPDHFQVAVTENGSLAGNCGTFSYQGQSIAYDTRPVLRVTAYNGLTPSAVTQSYNGSYGKLTTGSLSMPAVTGDSAKMGLDGATPVGLQWNPALVALAQATDGLGAPVNGAYDFTLGDDTFVYGRAANDRVDPFTPAVQLQVNGMTDDDGVTASNLPLPIDVGAGGTRIRFGRLTFINAHGSELQPLALPLRVEHVSAVSGGEPIFTLSTDDSCTSLGGITLADPEPGDALALAESCILDDAGLSGAFACPPVTDPTRQYIQPPGVNGFNLNLQAPGDGNVGPLDLTASAPAWLKYDWNGIDEGPDGDLYDDDPSAVASFGIHSGTGSIIYQREER